MMLVGVESDNTGIIISETETRSGQLIPIRTIRVYFRSNETIEICYRACASAANASERK